MRLVVVLMLAMLLMMLAVHCTWVTSNAYSSPSVVLANYNQDGTKTILDDFREAYYWLWQNTHPDARVMSWCAPHSSLTRIINNSPLIRFDFGMHASGLVF